MVEEVLFQRPVKDIREDLSLDIVGFNTRTLLALPVLYPEELLRTTPVGLELMTSRGCFCFALLDGDDGMDLTELIISSAILSNSSVNK